MSSDTLSKATELTDPIKHAIEMVTTNTETETCLESNFDASAIDFVAEEEQQRRQEHFNNATNLQAQNSHTNGDIGNLDAMNSTGNPEIMNSTSSDGVNSNNIISLMQSSPPPHSYRHSRAYRHFKNPPQPHMCIRTTTEAGEELFINVLSWTRIVIPQEPSDPIPLYGGMRVPPGSPRSPPIVFAVMANPEVLKDSGRHSKDPEERRAMVELMCDFVEAMNPGVKLVRNAVILKDRDISGELKDVWNAVQAQRDREREEQMLQQRQQQHYHNITTQQMFPKVGEVLIGTSQVPIAGSLTSNMGQQQYQELQQHMQSIDNCSIDGEQEASALTTPASVSNYESNKNESQIIANNDENSILSLNMAGDEVGTISANTEQYMVSGVSEHNSSNSENAVSNVISLNGNNELNRINNSDDQTDAGVRNDKIVDVNVGVKQLQKISPVAENTSTAISSANNNNKKITALTTVTPAIVPTATNTTTVSEAANNGTNATAPTSTTHSNTSSMLTILGTAKVTAPSATITSPPAKKDKLVGFLPNGCIFPRFKNNKNKDKDKEKDKEKEKESKGKEKTLLHALKKNKDKKVAPSEQNDKVNTNASPPSDTVDTKSQYDKNCINLENEVQRLDLNKIDNNSGNDVFIKLKVSSSAATAK